MISYQEELKKYTYSFNEIAQTKFGIDGFELIQELKRISKLSVDTPLNPRPYGEPYRGLQAQVLVAMVVGINPWEYIKTIPLGVADEGDFQLSAGRSLNIRARKGFSSGYLKEIQDISIYCGDKSSDVYGIVYYWQDDEDLFSLIGWIDHDNAQTCRCKIGDIDRWKELARVDRVPNKFHINDPLYVFHRENLYSFETLLPIIKI